MNIEYRMSKECILSFLYERLSGAIPPFDIQYSIFDPAESFDPEFYNL